MQKRTYSNTLTYFSLILALLPLCLPISFKKRSHWVRFTLSKIISSLEYCSQQREIYHTFIREWQSKIQTNIYFFYILFYKIRIDWYWYLSVSIGNYIIIHLFYLNRLLFLRMNVFSIWTIKHIGKLLIPPWWMFNKPFMQFVKNIRSWRKIETKCWPILHFLSKKRQLLVLSKNSSPSSSRLENCILINIVTKKRRVLHYSFSSQV
jgi:hypothetical protein